MSAEFNTLLHVMFGKGDPSTGQYREKGVLTIASWYGFVSGLSMSLFKFVILAGTTTTTLVLGVCHSEKCL